MFALPLVRRQRSSGASGGTGAAALYDRIVAPGEAQVEWPEEAAGGQARFLEGLGALHEVGALHDLEPGKQEYIGGHGSDPVLLVQGPPGTGKSYGTAFALFARLQGAMAAGRPLRAFVSCKTHAATDVLLENVQAVQATLRELAGVHPDIFTRYFDGRLLDVPLLRLAPKHPHDGIIPVPKDREREPGAPHGWLLVEGYEWCVVGATPGGVYDMTKSKWDKALFGHPLCGCLVLDEASQMNLPEALMASLPLDRHVRWVEVRRNGQVGGGFVVGCHFVRSPYQLVLAYTKQYIQVYPVIADE